jgi:uncharacterized protein (DUF433 family)
VTVTVAHPHVVVIGDSPMIAGSRVPVRRLYHWHQKGVSVETLVKRYSTLGWARVLDALSYAYDNQELVEQDLDRERALLGGDARVDPRQLPLRYNQRMPLPAEPAAGEVNEADGSKGIW